METENKRYLEKYGLPSDEKELSTIVDECAFTELEALGMTIDDAVAEFKKYRGKLLRYSKTHTLKECVSQPDESSITQCWWEKGEISLLTRELLDKYIKDVFEKRGFALLSPRHAAMIIMNGLAVYDRESGFLVIPDASYVDEMSEKELKARYGGYGIWDNNGYWLQGMMYCNIDPETAEESRNLYGCLCAYARSEIPAPATGVSPRMGDVGISSFADIVQFFKELFEEYGPDGWEVDYAVAPESDSDEDVPQEISMPQPDEKVRTVTAYVSEIRTRAEGLDNLIERLARYLNGENIGMSNNKWDTLGRMKNCELLEDEIDNDARLVEIMLEPVES